jgi:hypothetical protein
MMQHIDKNHKFGECGSYPMDYMYIEKMESIDNESFKTLFELVLPDWNVELEYQFLENDEYRTIISKIEKPDKSLMPNKFFVCIKEAKEGEDGLLLYFHDGDGAILTEQF